MTGGEMRLLVDQGATLDRGTSCACHKELTEISTLLAGKYRWYANKKVTELLVPLV